MTDSFDKRGRKVRFTPGGDPFNPVRHVSLRGLVGVRADATGWSATSSDRSRDPSVERGASTDEHGGRFRPSVSQPMAVRRIEFSVGVACCGSWG
jgi:hypothetical protein